VVGFLAIGAASFGTDALIRSMRPELFDAAGGTTNTGILLFTIFYVGVYAIAGCYLAAAIAGRAPMKHALILGALGLVFNIAGTVAMWSTAPAWYHVISLLLVMPYAWIGGRLREMQVGTAPVATRA
ncbi:MAG TPA: hypothetical protein VE861_02035, partial [Gemmatimonadaceae bacterium]|nr:hypothetical protein [Gemmatimonadaceae bacterium]